MSGHCKSVDLVLRGWGAKGFGLVAAVVLVVLWLSAPLSAAAQEETLALDPTHGLPGKEVRVEPRIVGEYTCSVEWDGVPVEGVDGFSCGQVAGSATFGSTSITVPLDAAVGLHTIRVVYITVLVTTTTTTSTSSSNVVELRRQAGSVSAWFIVDPPDTSTTTTTPLSPTLTEDPESTETGTSDSTATTESTGTSSSPVVVAGGSGTDMPVGLALLVAVVALAAAIATPPLLRGLRRRSPRWVARHLRVATTTGTARIATTGAQRRPATSVRLEVHVDQPRQGRPDSRKDDGR